MKRDLGENRPFEVGGPEVCLGEVASFELAGMKLSIRDLRVASIAIFDQHVLPPALDGDHAGQPAVNELDAGRFEAAQFGVREVAFDQANVAKTRRGDVAACEGDSFEDRRLRAETGQLAPGKIETGDAGVLYRLTSGDRFFLVRMRRKVGRLALWWVFLAFRDHPKQHTV